MKILCKISAVFFIAVISTAGIAAGAGNADRITAKELKAMLDKGEKVTLIDVRTPEEYKEGYIEGAINIPVDTIADLKEFPYEGKVVVYCKSGKRSQKAQKILAEKGIEGIVDLEGGITAWIKNGCDITTAQKSGEQAKEEEEYSSYPTNFVIPKGVCEQGIEPAMTIGK